ncbi:hypothetical protein V8F06_014246 [Rhypophila decipiens]
MTPESSPRQSAEPPNPNEEGPTSIPPESHKPPDKITTTISLAPCEPPAPMTTQKPAPRARKIVPGYEYKTSCFCSDNGGFCFSSTGGCFCSEHDGCFCSDNLGICCSDHSGCCYSDHDGVFCSDDGNCCCSGW